MKWLFPNWIADFFDNPHLQKELMGLLDFFMEIVIKEIINQKLVPLVWYGQLFLATPKFL